jgi:hypothetical protein
LPAPITNWSKVYFGFRRSRLGAPPFAAAPAPFPAPFGSAAGGSQSPLTISTVAAVSKLDAAARRSSGR